MNLAIEQAIFNAPIAEDFIVRTANGMCRYREDIRVVVEGAEFADSFLAGYGADDRVFS